MPYEKLLLEKKEDGIAVVSMNDPDRLNALDIVMSRELKECLSALEKDESAKAVVIKGEGRAFSSGGNLRDMRDSFEDDPAKYMDDLTVEVYTAVAAIENMSKPVIAQVHGSAYGAAMNMVLACDLAVAAEGTVFCESFLKIGLIPGGHATRLLSRTMGPKKAAELCYTAREVRHEDALSLGIVNCVVPPHGLEDAVMELAKKIAAAPPVAVRETKRLLREARHRSEDAQSKDERETQIRMAATEDHKEGVMSFFEKRLPEFKGK